MNLRTSIVLLIGLILVAGWVYFYEIRRPPEAEELPPWFYLADFDDIIGVSVVHEGESLGYFRGEDSQWYLDDPEQTPVDIDKWGGKVLLLSGPRSRRQLEETVSPEELAEFGLDEPITIATITLTQNRQVTIRMGDDAPVDPGGTYAILEGYSALFLIDVTWRREIARLVTDPPDPLWHRPLDLEKVLGLDVFLDDAEVSFNKEDDGWHFNDDASTPVDPDRWEVVLPLLSGPPSIRVVVAQTDDPIPYGVAQDAPEIRIIFQTTLEGVEAISSISYFLGDKAPDGSGYYAKVDPYPSILLLDTAWVETITALASDPPYPAAAP